MSNAPPHNAPLSHPTMYNPPMFRETRPEVLRAAMSAYPLAILVTMGRQGLGASHLPLLFDPAQGLHGVLRGHMARANPQWQDYAPTSEALAIFSGPEHYISPNWYASTQESGKVVPTWNYVTVHVRGTLTFTTDPAWLLENVRALTNEHEKAMTKPWRAEDAPPEYIDKMLGAIVGLELTITAMEGKWKVSQNRALEDRVSAITGLESVATPEAVRMAELVKGALPK
jgi:transcriptional regulator